jgi:hypothetical protein
MMYSIIKVNNLVVTVTSDCIYLCLLLIMNAVNRKGKRFEVLAATVFWGMMSLRICQTTWCHFPEGMLSGKVRV